MNNVIAFSGNTVTSTLDSAVTKDYTGRDQDMFIVESHPISGPYGVLEGKKGLFVNQKDINIVSDKYEVHQPQEILSQFTSVAESTGLSLNRVVTNPNNGGLLISAFYDDVQIVGEDHKVNLTFYTSHCGKYKTFLTLDLLRIACMNQVPALYRNKDRHVFAEKHYKNALDIRLIGDLLEHIPESIKAHNDKCEALKETCMTSEKFVELFAEHYGLKKEQKQYQSKVDKARAIWANAPGQDVGNNAYKAYQAVTFMNTHELRNSKMQTENIYTKASADSIKFMDRLMAA